MVRYNNICVVGLGYIGLPTAVTLANTGANVQGFDINPDAVAQINSGSAHIYEPGLDELVSRATSSGHLIAANVPIQSDAYIIAVPTPFLRDLKKPDLSFVIAAINSIAYLLKQGDLIIIESTVNVGATEYINQYLADIRSDLQFPSANCECADVYVAHCPERVLPGNVVHEIIYNDRIIGGISKRCALEARHLYQKFVKGDCTIASNVRLAELCKLAENSFRDVNIAFANELSLICSNQEIDVWELIRLANRHPRVEILSPGPGVGGHCIAVDPWFLVDADPNNAKLIRQAREVNDGKPKWVVEKFVELRSKIKNSRHTLSDMELDVAIYGLSFKPNIDDLRESPACKIAEEILGLHSGPIHIIEPNIEEIPQNLQRNNVTKVENSDAVIHIMLVDHDEFLNMKKPSEYVIDTKGIWTTNVE